MAISTSPRLSGRSPGIALIKRDHMASNLQWCALLGYQSTYACSEDTVRGTAGSRHLVIKEPLLRCGGRCRLLLSSKRSQEQRRSF